MEYRANRCGPWGYSRGWQGRHFANTPPVNIEETETGFILSVYAPSLDKQNINVTTQSDILSIRYTPAEKESGKFTRREYTGGFERSFDLKGKVDADRIEASYAEGVLKIILPKTDAAKKPVQDVTIH